MAQPKNIIDIVPLTRIPLNKNQSFSYLHERKLPEGTLVSVPLFKRNVEGIVVGSRDDFHRLGNIELKKINKVSEEKFLTSSQIKLAEFISEYYFSPLGIALKSFVPKRVKQKNHKMQTIDDKQSAKNIRLTRYQQEAVSEITKKTNCKFLLCGPASSGKTEVYMHSILEIRKKNPEAQFLILLPELTLTPQAIERYSEHFNPAEMAILHSKIPKGQFYSSWQKIKFGEAKLIIGSRMAVFSPFKNLGLIVVDEEQDMSFKQWDMNPRYDARTTAEKLAELHKCNIIFGSATPRVEDHHKAQTGRYVMLTLPRLEIPGSKQQLPSADIELIDLKKERWAKNQSPISKKLQAEIAYALKNKLQTILFINKQGMSNFSVCTQCKTVLRCPKCQRALIYDNSGIYRCVHCAYKTSITPACSKCNSLAFTNIGLGTQKIEREIMSLFPGARVARADNQSMKTPRAQEELYKKFKAGEIDILVGTQMISKGWDLPNVALVGIIDADSLLSTPDFTTAEKAYQSLSQLAGRVSRLGAKFPGTVLVQTFNPEQNFFKTATEKNLEKFYAQEIKERENLGLPPFGKLIKLIFQDYSAKKTTLETERTFAALEENASKNVKISEPQEAFVPNIRGRFRRQITIKISSDMPDNIRNILKALPSGWIIDIDPISLI